MIQHKQHIPRVHVEKYAVETFSRSLLLLGSTEELEAIVNQVNALLYLSVMYDLHKFWMIYCNVTYNSIGGHLIDFVILWTLVLLCATTWAGIYSISVNPKIAGCSTVSFVNHL